MLLALILLALPTAGQAQALPGTTGSDTGLWQALLEGLPGLAIGGRLEVLPAPIRDDADLPYPVTIDRSAIDSVQLAAREEWLTANSVRIAASMDFPGRCVGMARGVEDGESTDCPAEWTTRVAFGTPRPVSGGVVPSWRFAGRYAGRKADLAVRVVIQQLTPSGILVSSSDYYLAKDAFGWEVVARRVLAILE